MRPPRRSPCPRAPTHRRPAPAIRRGISPATPPGRSRPPSEVRTRAGPERPNGGARRSPSTTLPSEHRVWPLRSRNTGTVPGCPVVAGASSRGAVLRTEGRPQRAGGGLVQADGVPPGRPRTVFDPDLSARTLERLRRGSAELLPKKRPPDSRIRHRRNAGYLASAGVVAASWGAAHLATEVPDVTDLAVRVLSTLGLLALVVWGARQAGRVGAVLALLLTWGPLFLVWGAVPGTAMTGGAAFFWAAGPVAALALATKVTPSAGVRHHGRYLLPEDFEPVDSEALRRLQGAMDRLRGAAAVLGDDVGPGGEERWLAEQEWSVAFALAHCSELALDLHGRSREAVTERVSRALDPQRRALEAAREAVEERIRRFDSYARRAHTAATTY